METLLSKIKARMDYIKSNTTNEYVTGRLAVIDAKLQELKDRKYDTEEPVNYICDKIINQDIDLLKRVPGLADDIYTKLNEIAELVAQIPEAYFKEN